MSTTELSDTDPAAVDAAVAELQRGSENWAALTLADRVELLGAVRDATALVSSEWARTAADSKGLGRRHPLRGEEALAGPYAVLGALDAYIRTMTTLAEGRDPLDRIPVAHDADGGVRIAAFPLERLDGILLSGYRGEVWLRPARTRGPIVCGLAQRTPTDAGGVGLVLGAGNVTSIPVLDVLYELLAHNRVSLLKINPTQNPLLSVFDRALAPLVSAGFLRIITGGAATGAYAAAHPDIAHVHVTGSAATFDALVAAQPEPRPITAELGGVSPIIVIPGAWSEADLVYQAEHIATMRLHNAGHNCIAGQLVIMSADWDQADAFRAALRHAVGTAPERPTWYPGARERTDAVAAAHPEALRFGDRVLIEDAAGTDAESTEYFAPVLGIVALPGEDFLSAAVAYANEQVAGTLGVNIIVDPRTQHALGEKFNAAIRDLRFGAIAVNAWTGVVFATPTLSWGAFPGGTTDEVGSGIGVVHNALLLPDVERSVLYGPFRPFPRSVTGGPFTALGTPPWFVTAENGAGLSAALLAQRARGGILGLARVLGALRLRR